MKLFNSEQIQASDDDCDKLIKNRKKSHKTKSIRRLLSTTFNKAILSKEKQEKGH